MAQAPSRRVRKQKAGTPDEQPPKPASQDYTSLWRRGCQILETTEQFIQALGRWIAKPASDAALLEVKRLALEVQQLCPLDPERDFEPRDENDELNPRAVHQPPFAKTLIEAIHNLTYKTDEIITHLGRGGRWDARFWKNHHRLFSDSVQEMNIGLVGLERSDPTLDQKSRSEFRERLRRDTAAFAGQSAATGSARGASPGAPPKWPRVLEWVQEYSIAHPDDSERRQYRAGNRASNSPPIRWLGGRPLLAAARQRPNDLRLIDDRLNASGAILANRF